MNLQICNTSIRNFDGYYSLNDLHVASGNEAKNSPKLFLRLDTTKALCTEIEQGTDVYLAQKATVVKRGGNLQGSYGCKEIVYAYAMWISAKFALQVIRTYDAFISQPPQGDSYLPQIMAKASNTACTIAGHIASEMAKQVHNIDFTHRFLVAVDNGGVTIRNIDGCNLVNIVHVRKVRQDIRTVNKALQELLHRTRILEGEISPKDMDLPLVCSV